MSTRSDVVLYSGETLGQYGFGGGHPFNTRRLAAFLDGVRTAGLEGKVAWHDPVLGARADIERFHTKDYIARVAALSERGDGFLDYGDTPAFPGVYEISATVVGSAVAAVEALMRGDYQRAFVPIAGLHHAKRVGAAGFCVFNDCGVVIEVLKAKCPDARLAYVDIDAHHGDGVFYAYESDPKLGFADLHEDGRYLYPGTGDARERGTGAAAGTKLNIPMDPGSEDKAFFKAWGAVEDYLDDIRPDIILLQCGADSIAGDPLTHLRYTPKAHAHAARRLCTLANRHGNGRVLALGGGGYNLGNIAAGWSAVLAALIESD